MCVTAGTNRRRSAGCTMWSGWPYLTVLLVSFFVGVLGGIALAFFVDPGTGFSNYLRQYCVTLSEGRPHVSFFAAAWDCVRWPLLTAVLGLMAPGVVGIPVLFVVRGFLLSFSIATFGRLLGPQGITVAAALFAVLLLFVLPTLFVLGCNGLRAACLHLPNAVPTPGKQYRLETWLICIGVLAVSAAVQWTVIPVVLRSACSQLTFLF